MLNYCMHIIAGYILVDADERDAYVEAHQEMIQRARAFEGCLDIAITADSTNEARVNNFELWESDESMEEWRKVANAPSGEIKEDHVRRYDISSVGSPF